MSLKTAIDTLCDMTVSGITVYDLASLPGAVVLLPCLVPVLNYTNGQGLEYFTTDESGKVTVQLEHWLMTSGMSQSLVSVRTYNTLTHVDNYIAALATNWRLTDTLLKPLKIVGTNWGVCNWLGASYVGVKFRHQWEVLID